MEYIGKLLGLEKAAAASCPELPLDTFSYTIRHKYPERLITYDAEQRNEPRVVRKSDLTESKRKNIRGRRPKPRIITDRFDHLEQCSRALHEMKLERLTGGAERAMNDTTNWDGLDCVKKFRFYWQALTGHKLRPTPYANFKRIFMRLYHKARPNDCERRLRMLARRNWLCLSKKDRVPFNLQALLYHVSTGDVDPYDHCAIRVLLNRWR